MWPTVLPNTGGDGVTVWRRVGAYIHYGLASAPSREYVTQTMALRKVRSAAGVLLRDTLKMWSGELQALMDAAVDAVILIDERGRIGAVNLTAQRLFGFSAEELRGRNVSTLMPEPDRSAHDSYLARYATTGIPHIIGVGREVEAQRKDGSVFPVFLSVSRVGQADPPRFIGFVRDITLQRHAMAALKRERDNERQLQERMLHVSRMATLGEMAAGIAHELNQPLTAITNYALASEHLLARAQPDVAEVGSALHEIGSQALRAGEIIRKLRDLVGHPESVRAVTEINEVVEELGVLTQADARHSGTHLRIELAPRLPQVSIDRIQIQQVLLNLWRNAIEALASTSPGEREVAFTTRSSDCDVEICVSDNGYGVAPSIADRIFDPFYTTKQAGTGLGLAISRTIVQAHGGSIGYRANHPSGACFFVHLPSLQGC
jgi:two-component system sensor kinase FixL